MFTWTTIAQILWTSFATASYYVLFAVAFSLVLKVNGVFNFAQAGLMTVAFYAAHASIAWAGLGGPMSFAVGADGNAYQCMGARALRLRDDAPQSSLSHVRFHLHDRHLRIRRLSGHVVVRHLAENDLSAVVLARHAGRRDRGECMGRAGVALGVRRGGGAVGLHAVFAARPIHGRCGGQPGARGVLWHRPAARIYADDVDCRRLGRGRHVPLWNARPGSAADGPRADVVCDLGDNHRRHRQCLGRGARCDRARRRAECEHSCHSVGVAGLSALRVLVRHDHLLAAGHSPAGTAQKARARRCR